MCANEIDSSNDSDSKEESSNQPLIDLPQIERDTLKWWEDNQIFKKLVKKNSQGPLYRFLDGPITANNAMGVHHAWGRSLKDMTLRYRALNGYRQHFQNGFDCQGLWVEVEVEKALRLGGKSEIEKFGLDKFSQACKERIKKYGDIITSQSVRLGQWMHWDHSYYTHFDQNIQGIWRLLKKCNESGWLFKDFKPMMWCTRCGTSLSDHEMSGSYRELTHTSTYVLAYSPELDSDILVWTTTPWTLAANTALAVKPEMEYAQVEAPGRTRPLILATSIIKKLFGKKATIKRSLKGSELVGASYHTFFEDFETQKDVVHKVVGWKEVEEGEGTGVVHIAPGCGPEDFALGKELGLTVLAPIDGNGNYLPGFGFLSGRNIRDLTKEIIAAISSSGKLFQEHEYTHSCPICWRCKSEVVFRTVSEWFINADGVRQKLLDAAAKVEWQPEYAGKLMQNWLQSMSDWCISRKRYWGLPLPFYDCESCKNITVIGSKAELAKLSGLPEKDIPELHRPWIDSVQINCPHCKSKVPRVVEVGDCWLDAGIVPFSTDGCYDDPVAQTGWAPADYVVEMREQVRLWFYSMLFMGVTLRGEPPYKKVQTYEAVVNEDGSKFSKSGNNLSFEMVADQVGADAIRYLYARQSPLNEVRFGVNMADEAKRQIMALWNVKAFFELYAAIDNPRIDATEELKLSSLKDPTDQWLIYRLAAFIEQAVQGYETQNAPVVVRDFERFCDELSNWYVRANRRRFWKAESGTDKNNAYLVLFTAIRSTAIIMSPIMPFITEKVWQDCVRRFGTNVEESVHLASWPKLGFNVDRTILDQAEKAQSIINTAHHLRISSKIQVKQPLASLVVAGPEEFEKACTAFYDLICNELNVKSIRFMRSAESLMAEDLLFNFKAAGPALRESVNKAKEAFIALTKDEKLALIPKVKAKEAITLSGLPIPVPAGSFAISAVQAEGFAVAQNGESVVALETKLTPALYEEGLVRQLLRRMQLMRKEAGFEVQDRVSFSVQTESAPLKAIIEKQKAMIEAEALGTISFNAPVQTKLTKRVSLGDGEVEVGIGETCDH